MKNLKISGLTTPISDVVQQLRVDELKAGSRFRKLSVTASMIAFIPLLLSPVMTFVVAQRSLDAAKLFTSFSYLLLLADPLRMIFQLIPQFLAALACLGRIQAFLAGETRHDVRKVLARITNSAASDSEKVPEPDLHLSDQSALLAPAISIRNGYFGWTVEKIVLSNIQIDVPRSSLTIIVGPIACGKSTLTKALLGELPVSEGTIEMSTVFARIGFCDQTSVNFPTLVLQDPVALPEHEVPAKHL